MDGADKRFIPYLCGNVSKKAGARHLGSFALYKKKKKERRGEKKKEVREGRTGGRGGAVTSQLRVLELSKTFCLAWDCVAVSKEVGSIVCQLHESPD